MQALGMIEVIGYITAIEAADAALKSADIRLWQISKVGSGIVTVLFYGDVSAVKSAAEAGGSAAGKIGKVRSVHVIPRADTSLEKIVPPAKNGGGREKMKIDSNKDMVENIVAVESGMAEADNKGKSYSIEKDAQTMPDVTYSETAKSTSKDEELMRKSNSELKRMAEEIGISAHTIKNARKNDLVQMIIGGMNNA